MFTRYSNIDIPKNYSGSRFKKAPIEDTTMKIHESDFQNEVKTSVSPTYSNWVNSNKKLPFSEITDTSLEESLISGAENSEDNIEIVSKKTENSTDNNTVFREEDCIKDNVGQSLNQNKNFIINQITDFLKSLKHDDLLLIILITFLASDKNSANNEIIIFLAILLSVQ